MAQKKAHEVDGWLTKPNPQTPIVLIYGPDRGMVSERARKFARSTELPLDDPFAVLKLDAADLAGDAGRLIDEARTISMFGGSRLVWLRNVSNDKALANAVSSLCDTPPVDSTILLEAGDLKKGSRLRLIVEQAGAAMALPCYADNARAIDGLIDDELSRAGLTIGLEARQLLKNSLGGDRLASRSELEKLVLYCHGKTEVLAEDIQASIGDVSMLSQDAIVDAVLAGDLPACDQAFRRFTDTGANPFVVLSAIMRQLQLLQQLRNRLDTGKGNAASLVAGSRPPVFFARRTTVEKALVRWDASLIARMLSRLQEAILKTRRNADLAAPICRQLLMSACLEAARTARRR